jgi:hypothetical protein
VGGPRQENTSLDGVLFVEPLTIVHALVKHLTGSSDIKRSAPLLRGGWMRMVKAGTTPVVLVEGMAMMSWLRAKLNLKMV